MHDRLSLDHIVITAPALEDGVQYVCEKLGVSIPKGGSHEQMGTHNHLMQLGDDEFLEVIAINPNAAQPTIARWFGLDDCKDHRPQLRTWVARTDHLKDILPAMPNGVGAPVRVSRGNLSWEITVATDGAMPFEGAFPALIEWPARPYPGAGMPSLGCALEELVIGHPQAQTIERYLAGYFNDQRVRFETMETVSLSAIIRTASGLVTI